MNILATANAGGGFGVGAIAMYVVFIGAIFYFMAYRPNKKKKLSRLSFLQVWRLAIR